MNTELAQIAHREVEYFHRKGGSKTLVLVNGAGGPLLAWFGILEGLSEDLNVLAYNRPGVGKSSPPAVPQTAKQMAQELHELMAHLGIEAADVLVGHSLGGLVVLEFGLLFPLQTKAIVLLEPSTVWDIQSQKNLPTDKRFPCGELNFAAESATGLRDLSRLPRVQTLIGMGLKSSLLYHLFRRRFEQRRDHLRKLSQNIAGSEIVEFRKSGHFPQISEPQKVADLVNDLCRSRSALT